MTTYDEWKLATPPEYEDAPECIGCHTGLPVEETPIGPRHIRWTIPGFAQESFDCTATEPDEHDYADGKADAATPEWDR